MTSTIAMPVWVAVAAAVLALWAVLHFLLIPGGRWFVRRRVNRMIDELNSRLQLRIPAFQQTKRQVLIDRLTCDPGVMEAVERIARESGVPRDVLIRRVERHAREIVPSFNAWAYFRIGYALARRTAQLLYRVRLGYSDDAALSRIEPDASVVFVMNHRSNMDYVLVAYLAASRSALSYAVGEWARIWPLQTLVRSLGAYFVRRNSGDPLYRHVLARYVQAATAGGVVQAIYPEGNLSRDGRLRRPRLGLVNYMVSAFDPDGERDLVFVPVGINYDRVLEDRLLVHELDPEADPYPRTHVVVTLLGFVTRQAVLLLRRRWYRFGYACVNFGAPVSMRAYVRRRGIDFRAMDPAARFDAVEKLGDELLGAVASAIPVVPVALVATAFARRPGRSMSELDIKAEVHALIEALLRRGAYVHIPRGDRDYEVAVGLRMLKLRRFVEESDGMYRAGEGALDMLRYYANSIEHLLQDRRRRGPPPGPEQSTDRSSIRTARLSAGPSAGRRKVQGDVTTIPSSSNRSKSDRL